MKINLLLMIIMDSLKNHGIDTIYQLIVCNELIDD